MVLFLGKVVSPSLFASLPASSSLSSVYEARAAIGDQDPTLLRPEHASMNRFWCVFCDSDIDELGSSFACGNSINHMASADHLKNCKSLKGWEKKCKSLKNETPSEGSHSALIGPLNDIHNELNSEYTDSFDKNNIHSLNSSCSNSVVPLQNYTTERYQVSHSELYRVSEAGPLLHDANSYLYAGTQSDTNPWGSKDLTGYLHSQHSVLSNGGICSVDGYICNTGANSPHYLCNVELIEVLN
ncbi:unnamed protein product [Ilex paraguariensis]|uniref:Uncharacterized protein n=1 Tax=Ilex paraguariensis TaxID=185542 RepID=A0ABC8RET8_9AQUA